MIKVFDFLGHQNNNVGSVVGGVIAIVLLGTATAAGALILFLGNRRARTNVQMSEVSRYAPDLIILRVCIIIYISLQ